MMSFDFEPYVNKMLPELDNVDTESLINPFGAFRGDPKHRTIVCRHWLLGLCQNGAACGYLHRLDRSKMPTCKHGKLCKIKNCHLKHIDDQEVSECVFYKQGFCYNGPNCVRRHIKRLPDEMPFEAIFDHSAAAASAAGAGGAAGQANKKVKGGAGRSSNDNYKVSLCNHWLLSGSCHFGEECHFAHGEAEIQEGSGGGFHTNDLLTDADVHDPTRGRMDAELILPFALTARISYFLFQAPDLRSLVVSKRRGVWSVPVRFTQEINAALRAYDHVVAYMSVRALKGIYGVVKISGPVPAHPAHLQALPMTPEFPIVWLRFVRISMRTVAQLKIGTTGMFVGRTNTDSKFESKVGSELMYIAYRKPEWDWSSPSEYQQAEQYLVNHRLANGEVAPQLPPDALFGPSWIDQQMYGERKPVGMAPSTGANANAQPQALSVGSVYKQDAPGFIVNASGPVAAEMLEKSIFGLPLQLKDVAVINPGSALFLLDPQAQLLLGVYQATTVLTEGLEPRAFINWADPANVANPQLAICMLPLQVRFSTLIQAPPIRFQDNELQSLFREIGGLPMGGPIPLPVTRALANLCAARAGVNLAQVVTDYAVAQRGKQVMGASAAPDQGTYKPPFRNVDTVPININATAYELKRRLLGTNGSTVVQIATEVAGSIRGVKIRIRGIGSGFMENGGQELQQPLHFNVSAETEDMLQRAVEKVKALVAKVKSELESGQQAHQQHVPQHSPYGPPQTNVQASQLTFQSAN